MYAYCCILLDVFNLELGCTEPQIYIKKSEQGVATHRVATRGLPDLYDTFQRLCVKSVDMFQTSVQLNLFINPKGLEDSHLRGLDDFTTYLPKLWRNIMLTASGTEQFNYKSHIPEDNRPLRTSNRNKSYCHIPPVHSSL